MAKKIVDEVLNYTVIINGDKGQKELFELEKSTRKLSEANKDLRKEQARLKAEGKQGTEAYKRLSAEIKANTETIKANEQRMATLRGQIGITGLTMAQLTKEASRLRLLLRNLTPGSAEYKKYEAQLSKINARLKELRLGANQTKWSIKKLGDEFNRYQSLGIAIIASITGVVVSFQKLIDFQGKLSDAQADVAKTTGLSTEAVNELTKSLGLFKTRSARIELLQLAEEAGRLGMEASEDILEFVQVADKIKVALGDDLEGDVNDNIRVIGKLTEQYRVGADVGATFGEGMTMVGSAINEVAASGPAQAGYLVDYMSRLVGISKQAGIAADQQIGFAAVLDEAGQRVETSATATSQAIIGMYKDTATYANIAGMGVNDFRQLLETDANEAFLRFLEGLNGNNAGLEQLAQKFDGLGIDGSRAISVLATLASQTDKIREKQQLANDSLNTATSLQEEFNKKNTNFAAILNRIQKRLGQLITNSTLVKWLQDGIKWFAVFIGAIDDASSSAYRWREIILFTAKALGVFIAGLVSYKVAMQLSFLWTNKNTQATLLQKAAQKALLISTNAIKAATYLFAAAQALLTRNTGRATAAMRVFNTVTKLNPIGLLIGVITAATTALILYNNKLKEASVTQKVLNSVTQDAEKSISKEIATVSRLVFLAKSEALSRQQRIEAIEKLNKLAPSYLGNIKLEEINYVGTKKAIDNYIESLRRSAELKAIENRSQALYDELIEEQTRDLNEYTNAAEEWAYKDEYLKKIQLKRQQEKVDAINKEIEALQQLEIERKNAAETAIDYTDPLSRNILGNYNKPTGFAETEEERKARLERERKEREERLAAIKDAQKTIADFLAEQRFNQYLETLNAEDREIALLDQKYNEKLLLAKKYGQDTTALKEQQEVDRKAIRDKYAQQEAIDNYNREQQLMQQAIAAEDEQKQAAQFAIDTQQNLNDVLADFYKSDYETFAQYAAAKRGEIAETEKLEEQQKSERRRAVQQMVADLQFAAEQFPELTKAAKAAAVAETLFSTYKSAQLAYESMQSLGPLGPILGAAAAAAAVVAGLARVKSIKETPIQGYEEGLYPVRDQKGRKFNAGYISNAPTGKLNQPTILAGEKPEIIIDPLTTRHLEMNYPQVIDAIYASAARMRGYQSGHYPERTSSAAPNDALYKEMAAVLATNMAAITELRQELREGIRAVYDDAQVRTIRERLEVNNTVKQARTL